tara:strand:- start:327 stop:1490 length:1164 start_codon:yes stop_codon:yes gene_type:complete
MNVTEMHIAIQQGVDKINSLQADSLLSEEIDIELNKNMFRFINTKYGRNNMYRKGFEESQKRIDDLRTLVREYEAPVSFKEQLKTKIFVDTFQLPTDYMYLVNQQSRLWINNCQFIDYSLVNPPAIYFFTLDLNNFVLDNADGSSTAFINGINMVADITGTDATSANIWSPSASFIASGWTPESYPANIEATKQDILNNAGAGFNIYWEEYETLNYPGQFIVTVDVDSYDWINWDSSIGNATFATGVPAAGQTAPSPQGLQIMDTTYSERREPLAFSERITEGNRFSQQDDIFKLLSDPFNTTKHTSPLTTMRGSSIDIYTSDIFIIDTLKITYIRKPNEISLSLGVNCELPEHTHQEIVAMTVSSILEAISDPRYKSAIMEVTKNE